MNKITKHLWFDKEAKEAGDFYVSAFKETFPNGKETRVKDVQVLHNTPSGDTDIVTVELLGDQFTLISAGPYFKFNPSISFIVNFDPSRDKDARANLDRLWKTLSDGGNILMPLDKYPFSEHYGWIQDKYGLSWQLILTNPEGEERPDIIPALMFIRGNSGKAEEAINFYLSVFKNSPLDTGHETTMGVMNRYPKGMEPDPEGTVMFADFSLLGTWLAVMDSGRDHEFDFNEAVSFMVHCRNQQEIDYFWGKLSAVPESEQCGWLKDKYGVSWQIVPNNMEEMLRKGTKDQTSRVTEAFLKMKKLDLAQLQKAYYG